MIFLCLCPASIYVHTALTSFDPRAVAEKSCWVGAKTSTFCVPSTSAVSLPHQAKMLHPMATKTTLAIHTFSKLCIFGCQGFTCLQRAVVVLKANRDAITQPRTASMMSGAKKCTKELVALYKSKSVRNIFFPCTWLAKINHICHLVHFLLVKSFLKNVAILFRGYFNWCSSHYNKSLCEALNIV